MYTTSRTASAPNRIPTRCMAIRARPSNQSPSNKILYRLLFRQLRLLIKQEHCFPPLFRSKRIQFQYFPVKHLLRYDPVIPVRLIRHKYNLRFLKRLFPVMQWIFQGYSSVPFPRNSVSTRFQISSRPCFVSAEKGITTVPGSSFSPVLIAFTCFCT